MKLEDAVRILSEKIDLLLQTKSSVIIALDGCSASGKTTLSYVLQRIYIEQSNLFHVDDYFLRPEQRTPARYEEVGGNIDYERFEKEVLIPISKGQSVYTSRFNCATMSLEEPRVLPFLPINIVEGSYALHPKFQNYYDFSAFIRIPQDIQQKRIYSRNPETKEMFFTKWIPLEEKYFSKTAIETRATLVIKIEN